MRQLIYLLLLTIIFIILTACNASPITVPLDDYSISIEATANTLGYVVYPREPDRFEEPYINVKTITIQGFIKAEYTSVTGDQLQMIFYARATDPADDPDCDGSLGVVWICNANNQLPITNNYTFENGVRQPILFGSRNSDVLARGINGGKIWIGAEVVSGIALNVELEFTDMVAYVTIF